MTDRDKNLKDRIAAAKARHDAPNQNARRNAEAEDNNSALGQAMRVGIELVVAVAVGTFLGYWLDQWLGTAPFAMILFFFLGFAAGFLNIWRAQTGAYHKTGMGNKTEQPEMPQNADGNGLTNKSKDGQKDTNKNQN